MSFWKSITWQAWKRPIEIPSIYKEYNLSQKSLATLRRQPSPASPLSMLLQWCRLFFRYFFEPAKQHWAGGMGEKEATVQCYCLRLWDWKGGLMWRRLEGYLSRNINGTIRNLFEKWWKGQGVMVAVPNIWAHDYSWLTLEHSKLAFWFSQLCLGIFCV